MPKYIPFPDTLNWSLLHMFLVIAEERSINRAALRLNLTPSAVSHGLKRLERQLGCRLADRGHHRFSLTGHGMEFQAAALDIYKRINALGGTLGQEERAVADSLHLLLLGTLTSETFDTYLAHFRQRYPLVRISVEMLLSSAILKRIGRNEKVIGLALCRDETADVRRELLIPQKYALYCGRYHPLFTQEKITRKEILAQDFVTIFSDLMGDSLSPLSVFREKHKFSGSVVATANCQDEAKRLLYAGYGIGFLAEDSARKDELEGRLRRLPHVNGVADIPIYLVWSRQRKLKPVEFAFMNGLLAAFSRKELEDDGDAAR